MTNIDITVKKPIVLPCIASALCILCLFVIGQAGPAFSKTYAAFGIDPLPWNIRFISHFHTYWTLPLGGLMAVGLIWGSRRWSRKRSLVVAGLAVVAAVILFILFAFMAMMPIFHMSS